MGVDVFLEHHTHLVENARVGLITNPTGRTKTGIATIDALQQHPDINLVALFALEHGIKAQAKAGERVRDTQMDSLPVYSLYGSGRSLKAALDNIDVVIYDIQDVGSRAYTYIWSLTKIIKAAGEHHKRVIVLDRPNLLGGLTVDGPITEEKWRSLVGGLYPVPRAYGLTAGELARYLNREHLLACALTVVPIEGYQRNTRWADIGSEWIPPSPNIPSPRGCHNLCRNRNHWRIGNPAHRHRNRHALSNRWRAVDQRRKKYPPPERHATARRSISTHNIRTRHMAFSQQKSTGYIPAHNRPHRLSPNAHRNIHTRPSHSDISRIQNPKRPV